MSERMKPIKCGGNLFYFPFSFSQKCCKNYDYEMKLTLMQPYEFTHSIEFALISFFNFAYLCLSHCYCLRANKINENHSERMGNCYQKCASIVV